MRHGDVNKVGGAYALDPRKVDQHPSSEGLRPVNSARSAYNECKHLSIQPQPPLLGAQRPTFLSTSGNGGVDLNGCHGGYVKWPQLTLRSQRIHATSSTVVKS